MGRAGGDQTARRRRRVPRDRAPSRSSRSRVREQRDRPEARPALPRRRPVVDSEHDECPYKGLASFEEADASLFFGRERLVGELAARTVGVGMLGVVGASGSGKSSVIAAGLLPSLEAGLLPGSERWRSGRHASGRASAGGAGSARGRTPDGEGAARPRRRPVRGGLHRLPGRRTSGAASSSDLVATAGDPERAVVVVGIRGDYYGHCGAYPDLAQPAGGQPRAGRAHEPR